MWYTSPVAEPQRVHRTHKQGSANGFYELPEKIYRPCEGSANPRQRSANAFGRALR